MRNKFPKGHIPWSAGKTLPAETKRKISQALAGGNHPLFGTHRSEETRQKISLKLKGNHNNGGCGANNSFYGKHHTDEWRHKRSLLSSGVGNSMFGTKRIFSLETRYKMGSAFRGKKQSPESVASRTKYLIGRKIPEAIKYKISQTRKVNPLCQKTNFQKGVLNPQWAGGKSYEIYGEAFTKELKDAIRARDNYICQLCLARENGRRHACHHIDYCKRHTVEGNLITLCVKCNDRVNSNRLFWEAYFTKIIELKEFPQLGYRR